MTSVDCSSLDKLLCSSGENIPLKLLHERLHEILTGNNEPENIGSLIQLYHQTVPLIESWIFSEEIGGLQTELYYKFFQEMERIIAIESGDDRYHFMVVIPVADRPKHLTACLGSLLRLCELFNYGGRGDQGYNKVSVLIADDSKEDVSTKSNRDIAHHCNQQGLRTIYFGPEEQMELIDQLASKSGHDLSSITGNIDRSAFYHKGASITRNIAYLKLNQLKKEHEKILFYFIDSDQEFKVNVQTETGCQDIYAINYFYHLDQIFSNTDAKLLTGKVVGDPPVSPAVMAGNFLDDVTGFLNRMAACEPAQPCQFHDHVNKKSDDASYHDMAELFGFEASSEVFQYSCSITEPHDHLQCFGGFAGRLNQFFDGEHLFRKTSYEYSDMTDSIKPARTVYSGNYIFKPECLKYFIPFPELRLRMAGPVLGRIIQSEMDGQFVSANLPMLHRRTVEDIGRSEFRPGIVHDLEHVDLSGEFERQFFGDVVLFTTEKLTEMGYPAKSLSDELVKQALVATEESLRQKYMEKQGQILDKLTVLKSVFYRKESWWNSASDLEAEKSDITCFISNIEHNFGRQSKAYALMNSAENRKIRLDEILKVIAGYKKDRDEWQCVLDGGH